MQISQKRIKIIVRNRFNFETKQKQINKLTQTVIDDLIIITKTNFEKSLLFQTTLFMFNISKTILIIMLLLILKNNQCKKLNNILKCKLLMLNNNNNNLKIQNKIK